MKSKAPAVCLRKVADELNLIYIHMGSLGMLDHRKEIAKMVTQLKKIAESIKIPEGDGD